MTRVFYIHIKGVVHEVLCHLQKLLVQVACLLTVTVHIWLVGVYRQARTSLV